MNNDEKRVTTTPSTETIFLVDSHAHLQLDPLYEQMEVALINALAVNVHAIVVNAVCPGVDWDRVETLCCSKLLLTPLTQSPLLIPSFGLHPWWIDEMLTEEHTHEAVSTLCDRVKQQLRHKLMSIPNAGVGECGLDKIIKKRAHLDTQEALLRCHLELAVEFQRPVSLHCVGCWGRLFDMLQVLEIAYQPRSRQEGAGDDTMIACLQSVSESKSASTCSGMLTFCVVLHSCNKMPIDMLKRFQQLTKISIYYSFNGRQLDDQVGKLLAVIPKDKLLLETDSPDQMPPREYAAAIDETFTENTATPSLSSDKASTLQSNTASQHGISCNEPANVAITCHRVSALLGECNIEISKVTAHNAMCVFAGTVPR